jgi:hypothetical protein
MNVARQFTAWNAREKEDPSRRTRPVGRGRCDGLFRWPFRLDHHTSFCQTNGLSNFLGWSPTGQGRALTIAQEQYESSKSHSRIDQSD